MHNNSGLIAPVSLSVLKIFINKQFDYCSESSLIKHKLGFNSSKSKQKTLQLQVYKKIQQMTFICFAKEL